MYFIYKLYLLFECLYCVVYLGMLNVRELFDLVHSPLM